MASPQHQHKVSSVVPKQATVKPPASSRFRILLPRTCLDAQAAAVEESAWAEIAAGVNASAESEQPVSAGILAALSILQRPGLPCWKAPRDRCADAGQVGRGAGPMALHSIFDGASGGREAAKTCWYSPRSCETSAGVQGGLR